MVVVLVVVVVFGEGVGEMGGSERRMNSRAGVGEGLRIAVVRWCVGT